MPLPSLLDPTHLERRAANIMRRPRGCSLCIERGHCALAEPDQPACSLFVRDFNRRGGR